MHRFKAFLGYFEATTNHELVNLTGTDLKHSKVISKPLMSMD